MTAKEQATLTEMMPILLDMQGKIGAMQEHQREQHTPKDCPLGDEIHRALNSFSATLTDFSHTLADVQSKLIGQDRMEKAETQIAELKSDKERRDGAMKIIGWAAGLVSGTSLVGWVTGMFKPLGHQLAHLFHIAH